MMKTLMLIGLVIFSAISLAEDVTGRWTGMIMDQFEVVYDFKQDGDKITGTTVGPDGTTINITNGMIKGDDISYSINVMGGDMPVKGKIVGDTMKLTFTMDGKEVPFELKKQPEL